LPFHGFHNSRDILKITFDHLIARLHFSLKPLNFEFLSKQAFKMTPD
jgi:hypothetical protein